MAQDIFGKIHASKVALPGPLVANSCDPVDTRLVATTFADITTNAADTFPGDVGYCFIYEGIQIYVADEQSTYMYIGPSNTSGIKLTDVQNAENWVKVASKDGVAGSETTESITKIESKVTEIENKILSVEDKEVAGEFVTSITTDGQKIKATRAQIKAADIKATKETTDDVTVQAWLADLQTKVTALSAVDGEYLTQLNQLLNELKDGNGIEDTLIDEFLDKFKGLKYEGNDDATVKEYVDYTVNKLREYVNESIFGEGIIPDGIVFSVNGQHPDDDGNVELELGELKLTKDGKTLDKALQEKVDKTSLETKEIKTLAADYDAESQTILLTDSSIEVVVMK